MTDRNGTARPVDLWLLDLALTSASFLLAYRVRALLQVEGHSVMPFEVYLPSLAIILLSWAIVLPLFRVYSLVTLQPLDQIWRLTKAIAFAWIVMVATQFLISRTQVLGEWVASNRLILLFTLLINYALLVVYRLLLIRRKRHNILGIPTHGTTKDLLDE